MPLAASLYASGQLERRAEIGRRLLRRCTLCPRRCRVDRIAGEIGRCGIGGRARIAGYGPHFGEEAVLVGRGGSGTIFLTGCSLGCCFCQNFAISRGDEPGQEVEDGDFAAIMLELQALGCSNINLVTPSHVVPQILAALVQAVDGGLRIPLVYNSSGYDSAVALDLLAGAVDIYLPDCKFWLPETAARYAGAPITRTAPAGPSSACTVRWATWRSARTAWPGAACSSASCSCPAWAPRPRPSSASWPNRSRPAPT